MRNYGVIGFPIKHSFSPGYFTQKYKDLSITDCSYAAFEVENLSNLHQFIEQHNLSGLNVTMPYKQVVIQHLDYISHEANALNAVNTVRVENSKLYGYNTDIFGFRDSLTPLLTKSHTKALIFGTGGSSAAVRYVLSQLGIEHHTVSRSKGAAFTYESLTEDNIAEHTLLINTTPLGMLHLIDESVTIPYRAVSKKHLCYDLIYTPTETLFLKQCKSQGAAVKNGLQMLEKQADKSWDIWNM